MHAGIHRAADYIQRSCAGNGRFVYRVNLNTNAVIAPRYNMLRHAGTIYSLAMCEKWSPKARTRAALKRACRFLRKSVRPVPDRKGALAVWSDPKVTMARGPAQAKLGATGLGLIAFVTTEKVMSGTVSLDEMKGLGRFLVFMQKPDGSFWSRYVPEDGGRDMQNMSLYYPGEAAFGLLLLHEKDPTGPWLSTAEKALLYLARKRAGKKAVEPDHWALLATAQLFRVRPPKEPLGATDALLMGHAGQVCRAIINTRARHSPDRREYGCFTADGRTCPTATRLEGLLAMHSFLPAEEVRLRRHISQAAGDGVAFLLRAQVREGKHQGGITRAVRRAAPTDKIFPGSFDERATEIRIDYVQHTLSAFIQFDRLNSHRVREE